MPSLVSAVEVKYVTADNEVKAHPPLLHECLDISSQASPEVVAVTVWKFPVQTVILNNLHEIEGQTVWSTIFAYSAVVKSRIRVPLPNSKTTLPANFSWLVSSH